LRFSRGTGYMILATFFFSVMSILVKAGGLSLPPQELVFARGFVVLVITVVMMQRKGLPLKGKNGKLLILRGLFGFLGLSAFFYTLTTIPITDSVTLNYTSPLFTALLAPFLLKESNTGRQWGYFVLAFLGILLIIRPGFSFQIVPALIGLGGAFFAGLAYNTVRRLRHSDHPLTIVLYFQAVCIVLSLPWMIPAFVMPRGWDWILLLGMGMSTQIAQVFLTKSLHYETAARATNASYIGVVFSAIWGIIFFLEIPDWRTVIGAMIVIYAIARISVQGKTVVKRAPGN
jgi:drug/metabolite transporter (DMT)-like permease